MTTGGWKPTQVPLIFVFNEMADACSQNSSLFFSVTTLSVTDPRLGKETITKMPLQHFLLIVFNLVQL